MATSSRAAHPALNISVMPPVCHWSATTARPNKPKKIKLGHYPFSGPLDNQVGHMLSTWQVPVLTTTALDGTVLPYALTPGGGSTAARVWNGLQSRLLPILRF